jgi:hypothetical protein
MREAAIQHCRSYALEAERKMGEMLAATELNTGAKGIGKSAVTTNDHTPTLAELGITKNESSKAQERVCRFSAFRQPFPLILTCFQAVLHDLRSPLFSHCFEWKKFTAT